MPAEGVEVVTFGCRLNTLELEVMRRHAARRRARRHGDRAHLRRHRRGGAAGAPGDPPPAPQRPGARIVVTGCGVQMAPAAYAAMPEIDHLVGNAEKLRPESWAGLGRGRARASRSATSWPSAGRRRSRWTASTRRTRGFLQVQQGCDHRCTFCTIPFGRGPSRSVPLPGHRRPGARAARRRPCRARPSPGSTSPPTAGICRAAEPRRDARAPAGRGARAAAAAPVLARSGRDRRGAARPGGRASRGCCPTCTCRCRPAATSCSSGCGAGICGGT